MRKGGILVGLTPMLVIILLIAGICNMNYVWWGLGIISSLVILWLIISVIIFNWVITVLARKKKGKAYWAIVLFGIIFGIKKLSKVEDMDE